MPQNMPTLTLNADTVPPVVLVLLGIVVLLFGRSLYWAFIAIAGFLVGMALANEWLADKSEWIRILAAVGAGLLGAVVGILVQRLAFAIGGFFAGAVFSAGAGNAVANGRRSAHLDDRGRGDRRDCGSDDHGLGNYCALEPGGGGGNSGAVSSEAG